MNQQPRRMSTQTVSASRGLTRTGIAERVRINDLRHSAISALLAAGGSLQDAQALAGHASITRTADLYGHSVPDQRTDTAARMQAYLGAAVAPSGWVRGLSADGPRRTAVLARKLWSGCTDSK